MNCDLSIQDYLSYDPDTGIFMWVKPRKGIKANKVAGRKDRNGYITICFNYKHYLAHRLAWYFMLRTWPTRNVDHINGDKQDNRAENLRLSSVSENGANTSKQRRNTSGFKGVSYHKRDKRWRATLAGSHLGYFSTKELAAEAYNNAATKLYGEFARLNIL